MASTQYLGILGSSFNDETDTFEALAPFGFFINETVQTSPALAGSALTSDPGATSIVFSIGL